MILYAVGNNADALTHIKRALQIYELISGINHPCSAAGHVSSVVLVFVFDNCASGSFKKTDLNPLRDDDLFMGFRSIWL